MAFYYFIIFILGVCGGSFLNVLIYRLPRGEPVAMGRSFCPHCGKKLFWWELLPVLSFIFLKGRCSGCKKRISFQYPLVELLTGVSFLLVSRKLITVYDLQFTVHGVLNLLFWFFVISIFIVVFWVDLKHYIIPNKVVYTGVIVTFFFWLLNSVLEFDFQPFLNKGLFEGAESVSFLPTRLLSFEYFWEGAFLTGAFSEHVLFAIMGAGFFLFLVLLTGGRGMGMGDVKLAFFLGLVLGLRLVDVLFFSFWLGALVGLVLIATGRKNLQSKVPFGPFLVIFSYLFVIL